MSKSSQHHEQSTTNTVTEMSKHTDIIDVWSDNFDEEIAKISELLEDFPYVAMDTEFPGVVFKQEGVVGYQMIKNNVDKLKLIQVGICLSDDKGNQPKPVSCWQFNLQFDLMEDMHAVESIEMLKDAGIKFEELAVNGIDPVRFADELFSSGLLLNDDVHWITFHGAFDFAYLIKLVTNNILPMSLDKFKLLVKQNFPSVYDIKVIMKEVTELRNGSLQNLARDLDIKRVGAMHQAGSDSDLTLRCFFKLKELYFAQGIAERLSNKVYGLTSEVTPQQHHNHNTQQHHVPSQLSIHRSASETHRVHHFVSMMQQNPHFINFVHNQHAAHTDLESHNFQQNFYNRHA